ADMLAAIRSDYRSRSSRTPSQSTRRTGAASARHGGSRRRSSWLWLQTGTWNSPTTRSRRWCRSPRPSKWKLPPLAAHGCHCLRPRRSLSLWDLRMAR
uniref:Uncharacterized protein n=1 Tax=Aegilops tauschii subsp. strangulata TaxID=200361 RepID=A0A453AN39_AEGTS